MSRKGENIYKRKDGRWEARYIHHYEKGKAKYRSVYGKTYMEAKQKRAEEQQRPRQLRVSSVKQRALLEEICYLWLNDRKPDIKESTYTRYDRIIEKYILAEFYAQRIDQIDNERIHTFQQSLRTRLLIKPYRISCACSKVFGALDRRITIPAASGIKHQSG